jgi:hypothetical protein
MDPQGAAIGVVDLRIVRLERIVGKVHKPVVRCTYGLHEVRAFRSAY